MPAKSSNKTRCSWVGNDPLYLEYHDREWGVPLRDDRQLFEMLILEGAQAGLSWITILRKRENYRRAFDDFDVEKIARYNARKKRTLLNDAGIIRNRLKIDSTIGNARAFLEVVDEYGSFSKYLWGFVDGEAHRQSLAQGRRRAGVHGKVRHAQQGAEEAGLQVRRIHHLLFVHAGSGHDQRPYAGLFPLHQGIPRPPANVNQGVNQGGQIHLNSPEAKRRLAVE